MHPVFKNDPSKLKEYVDKVVKIETTDGNIHEGIVYTIDPVSECVVLAKEDGNSMDIIFHHGIKSMNCIGEAKPVNIFQKEELNTDDIEKARSKLKDWLQKNLIPIEECGDNLQLTGQLTIVPPYSINDCLSSNEIVLKKIQGLIESMPTYLI